MQDIFAVLEEPFLVLTVLELDANVIEEPIFPNPDQFLGGFTHLQLLSSTGIQISKIPKLLSSFTNLIDLHLLRIPSFNFVSPDEMVTAISTLTRLQVLYLGPKNDGSHPNLISRHNLQIHTLAVFPSLIEFNTLQVSLNRMTSWPGLMPLYLVAWK